MIDRHHLLECILWPNEDGTFRKIVNTKNRLKELGIYYDYKLTIRIEHSAHSTMHREFKKGTEYEQVGDNAPMYGKGYLISGDKHPMYGRTGELSPMYGRTAEKHPAWKGNSVSVEGKYRRALKDFRNNLISEETFQPYRDAWNEFVKERKRAQRLLNSLPID